VSGSRIAPAPPDGSPGGVRRLAGPAEGAGAEQSAGLGERDGAVASPAADFLKRAEVRDVLAWMRLLVDPQDAAAVVRALARPPIELRQVDLARVIALARRRKLDLVLGLTAATESPQVPPEARERIQRFAELHRSAAAELDSVAPDLFIARLIQRLGMRGRPLLTPQDAAEQQASLEALRQLAVDYVRLNPRASTRELARHLATVVPERGHPEPQAEPDPMATAMESESGQLEETLKLLREEVLGSVARIGGRLGELRLDTELDVSHGVVRYLELLKLSALLQRPEGQSVSDALADINVRLIAATTPLQREIFQTSALDDTLSGRLSGAGAGKGEERALAQVLAPREEPSLGPFLPRKGIGLALSASDIQTYRSCPLRYKFARVLRIPTEQTVGQRFGIVVHQVLERYHSEGGNTLTQLLELLDGSWRRAGFGESQRDRELREKAGTALTRYHARLHGQDSQPVWFERAFDFRLGPHHLRGRVDRVDRLGAGVAEPERQADSGGVTEKRGAGEPLEDSARYELIDYKTSRPKSAEQLKDDIQLSLYALAAREDWQLESSSQAYYYVLDDLKVPVARGERDADAVKDIVLEVGEGILGQAFEPTPSHAACSICDYRIVCPAAEV
jgi:CRISPR/Cas system-associated exonuclease Cas4 (RecB family)